MRLYLSSRLRHYLAKFTLGKIEIFAKFEFKFASVFLEFVVHFLKLFEIGTFLQYEVVLVLKVKAFCGEIYSRQN
jgi:hypothetical protein